MTGPPQNPLRQIVVERDARVRHEAVQRFPVTQQGPQGPSLRIHTGQLGTVLAAALAHLVEQNPVELAIPALFPGALEQLFHSRLQLLLERLERPALPLQRLLRSPLLEPLSVQLEQCADALDPLLCPRLEFRVTGAGPHEIAADMHPAMGEHHQVRKLLGKGLVRAVAVTHQHDQAALADQRIEQLPGGVQAPGRQDPHADRVAGQTGPQPELRLGSPAGRRVLVVVLARGQPLHWPGGLVGLGHRLLLWILSDRRSPVDSVDCGTRSPSAARSRATAACGRNSA